MIETDKKRRLIIQMSLQARQVNIGFWSFCFLPTEIVTQILCNLSKKESENWVILNNGPIFAWHLL